MVDWLYIIELIRAHGYLSLFMMTIIGLYFFPVPNEVLLMSGGFLASTYLLDPIPAFIVIYSCVLLHGTILFIAGVIVSHRTPAAGIRQRGRLRSKWRRKIEKGRELLNEHGLKVAIFSYFFPFIRHAVPFSIGMSNVSYRSFSLVSFSSALVWTTIYFLVGLYYGRTIKDWGSFVEQMIYTFAVVGAVVILYFFMKKKKKRPNEVKQ